MAKNNRYNKVKNFGFNTQTVGLASNKNYTKEGAERNLKNYTSPVQLSRLRTDIKMWRDAVGEMERAYYPFRVKAQRMYIDTVLNGHIYALMERRKDLTLLRNFSVVDKAGTKSEVLTEMLSAQNWFYDFQSYALDAIFFGYSLISLGDIVEDKIKEVNLVPRWFVSPDRYEVGSYIYATSGADFREPPQADWHVYVKTQSDNGVSPCGYGLFYQIAMYEIYLRNTLGFNSDFVELFAMPYRVGKTTKTTESERGELEAAIRDMGSAGYAIIDPMDEIEFLEMKSSGTGYKAYESLELRCEKKVSKIMLGHADAVDSTPGKLGSGQGSKDGANEDGSPVQKALDDKQSKDARFMEPIINNQLFPKLKLIGAKDCIIPDGYQFAYINDNEDEQFRSREDASNLITATIAQTMKAAGLQMDSKYFSDRTGIVAEAVPDPVAAPAAQGREAAIKNRLRNLYK
jgi:phage gp29-like protein